jgi:ATP-dependent protease ClpP protease subunit
MKKPFVFYINFFVDITDKSVRQVMNVCSNLLDPPKASQRANKIDRPDSICLSISSSGGNVDSGIALYNFIRSLPIENRRYAVENSSFFLHGISKPYQGSVDGFSLNRAQLLEALNVLEGGEVTMRKIIAERTLLTDEELTSMFNVGTKETPELALAQGIIHKIRELKLPPNPKIYIVQPDK